MRLQFLLLSAILISCSTPRPSPRLTVPPMPPRRPMPALAEATEPQVTFAWDPSPSPEVVGYFLYHGRASRTYTNRVDVGNVTNATVPRLSGTNFYTVTAADAQGLESDYSNEVTVEPFTLTVVAQSAPTITGPWTNVSTVAVITNPVGSQFWRLQITK